MNILSIQSWVVYGHVGNAASVFPLQRLGAEVWALNTVQFSNHTGYGAWTGQVFPGAAIDDLVAGIAARGVLGQADAVLSGYVGDPDTGGAILRAVERVRAANPDALYACDPVIGDVGRGVFVRPGIAEHFRDDALAAADILTPNHFELSLLAGAEAGTLAGARAAVEMLRGRMRAAGPRAVLVTSLATENLPGDEIELLAAADDGAWRVRTPRLDVAVNGAGDAIAALFLFHMLEGRGAAGALAAAAGSIYGLIERTHRAGGRELALVAAQEEFVAPSHRFAPLPC